MAYITALMAWGWIVFWLYWLISAFGSKKNTAANINRFVFVRLGFFVLAFVIVRLSASSPSHLFLTNHTLNNNEVVEIIGFIVFVSGLCTAVWARLSLGKNWGMPMSHKQNPELVVTGPYRFVRHPIYTGVLLAILGSALAISIGWFILLILLSIYFTYSAVVEEKIMTNEFPKDYPNYKQKTKMLLPFIL